MTQPIDARTRAVRRALRLIDGGASSEFAIGDAYNMGHIHGQATRTLAEAEVDLCNAIREMTDYQALAIRTHIGEDLGDLVDAIREPEPSEDERCSFHQNGGVGGCGWCEDQ